jgi:hypothetical protein
MCFDCQSARITVTAPSNDTSTHHVVAERLTGSIPRESDLYDTIPAPAFEPPVNDLDYAAVMGGRLASPRTPTF